MTKLEEFLSLIKPPLVAAYSTRRNPEGIPNDTDQATGTAIMSNAMDVIEGFGLDDSLPVVDEYASADAVLQPETEVSNLGSDFTPSSALPTQPYLPVSIISPTETDTDAVGLEHQDYEKIGNPR